MAEVRAKSQKNALAKHIRLAHDNTEAEFVTKCIKGGITFNLNRFILEALVIEDAKSDQNLNLMNSRSEWGGRGLPRITVSH